MSSRSRRRVLQLVAAVTLLAGCAGQALSVGDVTVLVSERTGDGMDALSDGRLEVVGGCLGAGGNVVVWPHGTKVADEEPLTIAVPGYGTFGLGDEVQVGGGYVREQSSDDVASGAYEVSGVTVPAECAQHGVFLAH
jgi:hypothetical protein